MDVRFVTAVINKVIEGKRCPGVPPVLAIRSPVAAGPVVASVPITGGVLVVHVEPQALHRVRVQDVGKGEGLPELQRKSVPAEVHALGPVNHLGVGCQAFIINMKKADGDTFVGFVTEHTEPSYSRPSLLYTALT